MTRPTPDDNNRLTPCLKSAEKRIKLSRRDSELVMELL